MRSLAEKYPEFAIESGLRDYYLAEAQRLRDDFEKSTDIAEKLGLARSIEGFLDRAAEYERRMAEKYPEFGIESGLRDYYLAEANRLRIDFEKTADIAEKLGLGRSIEAFLDRAADYDRRIAER